MSQADKLKQGQFTNPETPGYVGFANLPNQVHRKSVKKGFEFTLMVVGESGLGKSTLINSLFLTDLYPERVIPGAAEKIERTVQIEASTVEIEERGVKLRLTVVDTPGYGDAINSQDWYGPPHAHSPTSAHPQSATSALLNRLWGLHETADAEQKMGPAQLPLPPHTAPSLPPPFPPLSWLCVPSGGVYDIFSTIIAYIDDQFERYLHDESGLNRRHIVDNRVHCCFYFISPLGHGLKPLDVQFMKAIHNKVNVVPVIAKADTLTLRERERLKRRILDEIDEHGIKIYHLPDAESDEDEDFKEQTRILKVLLAIYKSPLVSHYISCASIPFAVVGSNQQIEAKGKKVRGRLYPWGVVEVENPEHNDFLKLRTMLITHMQDLQEVTQDLHYENFRSERLKRGGRLSSHGYVLPLSPAYVPVCLPVVNYFVVEDLRPTGSGLGLCAGALVLLMLQPDRAKALRQRQPRGGAISLPCPRAPMVLGSHRSAERRPITGREPGKGGSPPLWTLTRHHDAIQEKSRSSLRRMQEMIAKMQAQMQKQGDGEGDSQQM
ncbi:hypothetical protein JZ751_013727 [Albula glossodonta]|uniref:Septin-type G domain-containing protein n=1 Tax=Albula glossodonta TaxID=121402 RepID=A0A8T2P1P2_9TELE|nr:hypothetical protein JZ751_013727 [Albula glossodonta]